MENKNERKKTVIRGILIIVLFIVIIFGLISFGTMASHRPLTKNTLFSTLKLDEDAYGDVVFDSSNLKLKTILDKDVETSLENVIYISFWVGGNEKNDAVEPSYDIALQDLKLDCDLLSPYVRWKLLKNGEELSTGSLDYQFDTIKDGRLVLTPIQQDLVDFNEDKSKYDYYQFYLWLSDSCQDEDVTKCDRNHSQDMLLEKKISGKIEVQLYSQTKENLVRNPSDVLDTDTCIESN